jgi:hypothetical protein
MSLPSQLIELLRNSNMAVLHGGHFTSLHLILSTAQLLLFEK